LAILCLGVLFIMPTINRSTDHHHHLLCVKLTNNAVKSTDCLLMVYNESRQTPYALVRSKRNKRPRNQSNQQPASNTQSDVRQTSSILGKSRFPGSKMVAARDIRKKSVFCIDNLNISCTVGYITEFVTNELSIEVLIPLSQLQYRKQHVTCKAASYNRTYYICQTTVHSCRPY